jgi:hypothetical protein
MGLGAAQTAQFFCKEGGWSNQTDGDVQFSGRQECAGNDRRGGLITPERVNGDDWRRQRLSLP